MNIITYKGRKLAYEYRQGKGPTVVFFPGFMSDMEGSKALALEAFCQSRGQAYVRFDYSGHGKSSGAFTDGTIGAWKEDALAIIDQVTTGDLILVGSSMGGWIGLLCALARKDRVKGFVGLAAAPDFTKELCWDTYSDEIKTTLRRDGVYYEACDYGDKPYAMTMTLLREGNAHLIMGSQIDLDCPVRLIQGMKDTDVPPHTAQRISDLLASEDVVITYVKNGDHRLSSDGDLKRLCQVVKEISGPRL
ncbi:MAG: alpha/beta hydrolase [Alphaproteobacteria bacterium]|nr:MAG: alpha/beta hydrolase [Alphaproteobacteria bacterium]